MKKSSPMSFTSKYDPTGFEAANLKLPKMLVFDGPTFACDYTDKERAKLLSKNYYG